uniref:Uncharacterized protein n=1 Tax=Glossina austeni TaxID=7395 RepID=A0A1A9ULX7_GLOAU
MFNKKDVHLSYGARFGDAFFSAVAVNLHRSYMVLWQNFNFITSGKNVLIAATCPDGNCSGQRGLPSSRGVLNDESVNDENSSDKKESFILLESDFVNPTLFISSHQSQFYLDYHLWGCRDAPALVMTSFMIVSLESFITFEICKLIIAAMNVMGGWLCIHNWQLANNATFEKGRKKGNPDASDAFSFTVTTRITFVPDDESDEVDLSTITGRLIDEILTILCMEIELSNSLPPLSQT